MGTAIETEKKVVKGRKKASSPKLKNQKPVNDYIQRVEKKAYELYLQRACQDGNDLGDWYEAERIVEAEIIAGQ